MQHICHHEIYKEYKNIIVPKINKILLFDIVKTLRRWPVDVGKKVQQVFSILAHTGC